METRSRRRNTIPLARLVAGFAAIGVALFTWRVLPPGATPASRLLFAAALLGGGCGLLGAFAFTRGTASGYTALWIASGIYLALALPTLLSVGAVFLAAASLTAFALIRRPSSSGLP